MDNVSQQAQRRPIVRAVLPALGLAALLLLTGCADRIATTVAVRPDGSWTGKARLTFSAPAGAPPGWQVDLDGRVAAQAAELLDGRDITYHLLGTATENQQQTYTWGLAGKDLGALAGLLAGEEVEVEGLAGALTLVIDGQARAGEEMELALPANPSTGYGWAPAAGENGGLVQIGRVESRQLAARAGAPARQVMRFRAVAEGPVTLRLDYRRPWQPEEQADRLITVRAPGQDVGRVLASLSMPSCDAVDLRPAGAAPAASDGSPVPHPSSFNWCDQGACTPIRDQGGCGSCWAFSTVGAMELAVKRGGGPATDLSEQYLVSCNGEGWGCGGGWLAHDYHDWKYVPPQTRAGAVMESAFPYQAADVPCGGAYQHPYQIESWAYVNPSNPYSVAPVNAIRQAIAEHGPVSVALCAGSAFGAYRGGVFSTDESGQCGGGINHAVVLVGWSDAEGTWILRNSWGAGWGAAGYMRIAWNTSNVGYGASYVSYEGDPPVYDNRAYLPRVVKRAR